MANDAGRAEILDELLRQAGIPISGVTVTDVNATPVLFTIDYLPEATAEQIALGDQMGDAFDWRKRRALPRTTVVASVGSLTIAQRAIIDAHMRAEHLRNNPRLAAAIGAFAEVPIVVDEVDPT